MLPKKLNKYLYLYKNRELDLLSGYLSFTTLLSLIPFLALIIAIAKWVGHRDALALEAVIRMLEALTPDAATKVRENVVLLLQNVRIKRLGVGAVVPLAVILILKLRVIRDSFRSVLGVERKSSWFVDILSFAGVIALSPVAFAFFDQFVDFAKSGTQWLVLARASKLILWTVFILVLSFVCVPLRVPWRRQFFFAALGGLALYITNLIFSGVVSRAISMNKLYGAFASVPLFLLWIYVFWRTVTLCVVFTCEPYLQLTPDGRVKSIKSQRS